MLRKAICPICGKEVFSETYNFKCSCGFEFCDMSVLTPEEKLEIESNIDSLEQDEEE